MLTVLAGAPEKLRVGYNARTTRELFAPKAVQKRREEDVSAMKYLSVRPPLWLGLYDNDFLHRFRGRNDHSDISREVDAAIQESGAGSIVTPLGLKHSDHIAVADACIELALKSDFEWYLYMDMPYAQRFPELFLKREQEVRKIVNLSALEPLPVESKRKHDAFKLYRSQYVPLGGNTPEFDQEMMTAERYWAVVR